MVLRVREYKDMLVHQNIHFHMKDVNKAPVFALKTFWIRIVRSPILQIV